MHTYTRQLTHLLYIGFNFEMGNAFVKLFKKYSPSELRLPKLHNWCYHIFQQLRNMVQLTGSQQKPMNLYIRILLKTI